MDKILVEIHQILLRLLSHWDRRGIIVSAPKIDAGTTSGSTTINIPDGYNRIDKIYVNSAATIFVQITEASSSRVIAAFDAQACPNDGFDVNFKVPPSQRQYNIAVTVISGPMNNIYISFGLSV